MYNVWSARTYFVKFAIASMYVGKDRAVSSLLHRLIDFTFSRKRQERNGT